MIVKGGLRFYIGGFGAATKKKEDQSEQEVVSNIDARNKIGHIFQTLFKNGSDLIVHEESEEIQVSTFKFELFLNTPTP